MVKTNKVSTLEGWIPAGRHRHECMAGIQAWIRSMRLLCHESRKGGVTYNKRSFDVVGVVTSGVTQTWSCRVVTMLRKGGVTTVIEVSTSEVGYQRGGTYMVV